MKTLFIGGQWVIGEGAEFVSVDPATGREVWKGAEATAGQVGEAIAGARRAFLGWSGVGLEEREAVVRRFGGLILERKEELSRGISLEVGKPLWESRMEVDSMVGKVEISIESLRKRRLDGGGIEYRPFGVMGVLGPFNMPGHLPNGHVIPAILAGNAVVFKPSELAAGVGERMVRMWEEAGLPAGVLGLVQGGREVGEWLICGGIDGVLFTGSAGAGVAIGRTLAEKPGIMAALEMGGNNPLVVHEVGDLKAAAVMAVQSAFITAGQRCSCARRLIVVAGREGDLFLRELVEMAGGARVGAFTDEPEVFMGPVITEGVMRRLVEVEKRLAGAGGKTLLGMRVLGRGALLSPGIIDVTAVLDRGDEEYFGPLLQVIRVGSFEEAVEEAGRTRYGLAAGLFSDDLENWKTFVSRVRVGVCNWNKPTTGASSRLPFGGMGDSGNNRPGGSFAADYCSYPVAVSESSKVEMPVNLMPGLGVGKGV